MAQLFYSGFPNCVHPLLALILAVIHYCLSCLVPFSFSLHCSDHSLFFFFFFLEREQPLHVVFFFRCMVFQELVIFRSESAMLLSPYARFPKTLMISYGPFHVSLSFPSIGFLVFAFTSLRTKSPTLNDLFMICLLYSSATFYW